MWLLGRIKAIVNRLLKPVGHRIDLDSAIPCFENFAALLKKNAQFPKTVFDIGVATGTPWLYSSFPDSKYYLVDPTPQSLPYMQKWAKTLNAEIWNFALGNYDGTVAFNVRCDQAGSTIFEEFGGKTDILEKTTVPIHRFDTVAGEICRPALLKIDIQGAEVLMLEGMGDRI